MLSKYSMLLYLKDITTASFVRSRLPMMYMDDAIRATLELMDTSLDKLGTLVVVTISQDVHSQ